MFAFTKPWRGSAGYILSTNRLYRGRKLPTQEQMWELAILVSFYLKRPSSTLNTQALQQRHPFLLAGKVGEGTAKRRPILEQCPVVQRVAVMGWQSESQKAWDREVYMAEDDSNGLLLQRKRLDFFTSEMNLQIAFFFHLRCLKWLTLLTVWWVSVKQGRWTLKKGTMRSPGKAKCSWIEGAIL